MRRGVLVASFAERGYDIIGLDLNYSSSLVTQADITRTTPFGSSQFDVILILDVLEHLCFADQEQAMVELDRLLKPGTASRQRPEPGALFFAAYLPAARPVHPYLPTAAASGDRPASEYEELLERHGFSVIERRGFFPTFPCLCSTSSTRYPRRAIPYHRLLNRMFGKIAPAWCFLSVLVAVKGLPDAR